MVIYSDGAASRDFMHVDDICAALRLALDADVLGGTVLHVASGSVAPGARVRRGGRQADSRRAGRWALAATRRAVTVGAVVHNDRVDRRGRPTEDEQ
jgi:nucleoside-diphosphate-sugar epimerase